MAQDPDHIVDAETLIHSIDAAFEAYAKEHNLERPDIGWAISFAAFDGSDRFGVLSNVDSPQTVAELFQEGINFSVDVDPFIISTLKGKH